MCDRFTDTLKSTLSYTAQPLTSNDSFGIQPSQCEAAQLLFREKLSAYPSQNGWIGRTLPSITLNRMDRRKLSVYYTDPDGSAEPFHLSPATYGDFLSISKHRAIVECAIALPQLKNSAFQKAINSCRILRSDGVMPRKSDRQIRLRGLPSLVSVSNSGGVHDCTPSALLWDLGRLESRSCIRFLPTRNI